MIDEIIQLLKQLPTGSQAKVRSFAQAELNRLQEKARKRNQSRSKRMTDPDPPMYRL